MQIIADAAPQRRIPPSYPGARAAGRDHDGPREAHRAQIADALAPIYPELGVNDGAARLLGYLISRTQTGDWATPGAPILVWIKNADLAFTFGCALSSIKRRLRQLRAAGLIVDKNSPNGARYGSRDPYGNVDQSTSFGIDLSPLAARYHELLARARAKEAEQRIRKAARRRIRAAERDINDLVLGASLSFSPVDAAAFALEAAEAFEAVPPANETTESLNARAAQLESLLNSLDIRFQALLDQSPDKTPKGANNDPLIPNTTQEPHISGKGAPSEMARRGQAALQSLPNEEAATIPLQLVAHACPRLSNHKAGAYENWRQFVIAAFAMAPYLGISRAAVDEARASLGEQAAAVALAIILERAEAGDVSRPGGYLRAMCERNRTGELRLRKSLFGLARAHFNLQ